MLASKARLSCPSKTAMQAGLAKTNVWVVEFPDRFNYVEPLMGWVGCQSTSYQQKLTFNSKDAALAYLHAYGIPFEMIQPELKKIQAKIYGDHFKADRVLK